MPGRVRDFSRRAVVGGLAASGAFVLGGLPPVQAGAIAGFEPEPWFASSTGDLSKDLAAAQKDGKYLALLWEQRGCHYCQELHSVNFKVPEIIDMGKRHFHTLQMDLWGKRKFVDLDGETRTEADIAKSKFVRATPVMQFIGANGAEVFRMPGYAPPVLQVAVYQYVAEKGYKQGSFRDWVEKQG